MVVDSGAFKTIVIPKIINEWWLKPLEKILVLSRVTVEIHQRAV